eukprot:9134139-Prorocentrum_lima.AAC.1
MASACHFMPSVVQPSGNPPESWHLLCIPGSGCGRRGVGVGCGYWACMWVWVWVSEWEGDCASCQHGARH